jgi:hypothetical protein
VNVTTPTSISIPPAELRLIDAARGIAGKSRSQFLREAGLIHAETVLVLAARPSEGSGIGNE